MFRFCIHFLTENQRCSVECMFAANPFICEICVVNGRFSQILQNEIRHHLPQVLQEDRIGDAVT
jgi:hypothetical protein